MKKLVVHNNDIYKPTRDEAEEAVRTLIRWAGDDPNREGLLETPKRVIDSYNEFFSGYETKLDEKICKLFPKKTRYDDIIMLRDIKFESFCEHHLAPISGKACVAYVPDQDIIGLSKLARIVDMFAKRLQIQERMVIEIAETLNKITKAKGVGVIIEATHNCMTSRGVCKSGAIMRTSHLIGCFREDNIRAEFINKAL